jgi:natural product biosynthesis luciferase-like monooxygenase protein
MQSVEQMLPESSRRPTSGGATYRCAVIGDDSLAERCIELLTSRGHVVTCFVTSNHALRRWAEERQMRVMDVSSDWVAALRDASLDYLFSVADPHVLSSAARQCARRGSIGVHDGPLRRHAGIAGPAWSITDGAREHCVSWRRLDEAADAGVMLFQRVFPVAANEDAGVLRARCIEAGAETFAELLDDLESEFVAERGVPPDRATMHGAADRPAGRSVISWRTSAADVDALVQALDHGTYANPVAVPTVYTSKGVFVVLEFEVLPGDRPTAAPGTLVAVDAAGWVVSTATADVRIGGFHEVDGTALTPARVAELARVAPGDVLPVPPADAIARIDAVSRRIHRHEAWWVGRLASLAPLRVPASGTAGPDAGSGHDRIASVPVGLEWSRASTGSGTPDDHLAAAVLAYLARVTGHTTFDIGWRDQATADTVAGVECWFAPVVPVHVALTPESDAEAAISAAFDGVRVARERTSYSRTVAVRYPALRQAPVAPLPVVVESVNALARSASAPLGDLTVTVCAPEQVVRFRSRDGRYTARDLERLTSGFLAFVQAMARAPHQALATLPVMDETEARRVLREWNATAVNVPPACIHHLIEAQVRRTPDAIALHALDGSVTYRELDRRANRLARLLQQAGVGPDQPVGLCLPRTSELVIAVVAIHKAGGAYVPLDPSYPAERVRYMLEDSGAAVLVTTAALAAQFPDYAGRVVSVESLRGAATERDDTDIAGGARPEHLAYRIYTSGSTGLPKGVDVEHRNVVNFFAGMDARIGGGGPGTWLAVTSLSFDISVLELCWTLARGFTVVLADDAHAGAQAGTHSGGADGTTHAGRGIDFSLFYFSADEHEHAREKYRLLLEGARFADRNGFVAVWTPERHFHAFGGLYPNPSVTGAAIAAITERVQIRAGSCVLPLHHPLRVVEEWSVVDNLSGGRVGVSFAAGWQPNDFVLRPEGYATAKERFLEDIDTVRRLWRGESLPFTAPNGQTVELRTLPRPIQPTLPAWYTTAGNPESYTAAGRAGLNLLTHLLGQSLEELRGKIALYREAWREAGHPGRGHVSLMLHAFVGDDEAQVKETVREPLTAYLRTSVGLVKQYADTFPALKKRVDGTTSDLDLAALAPAEMEALLAYSFERYYETSGLFGTPERAAGMVDRVKGADVDEIACLIDFGIESARVLAHLAHLDRLRQLTGAPAAAPPAAPAAAPPADARSLPALAARHGATHLQCTPSMAAMLLATPEGRSAVQRLRMVLIGGEAFPPALARELRQLVAGEVHNMYGPTETAIWSTTQHVVEVEGGRVPIGTPIANTTIYVADARGQPVPPGVPGELLIGGAGVVRGYHARPDLTAQRFGWFEAPGVPRERVYRTGDLAAWRDDGRLEFLGRLDHQVKIRGHRIELGEIEARLATDPSVREAVVIAREDVPGDTRLVGYVVARAGVTVDIAALRERVRGALPDWMVPAQLVVLADLPRTPNKKVDRQALPAPDALSLPSAVAYVAPTSSLEETISGIWAEVLRIERVGTRDNFFDLGGHSLLAVQVHAKLTAALQREITITDLFRFPTVATLARHLAGDGTTDAAKPGSARADARREALRRRAARANPT